MKKDQQGNTFRLIKTILINNVLDPIYPTPPLGQDMTPGQFLSGVQQV